ncbi:MAG: hypothetical protein KGH64_04210 [Candidatus Micrarchaeota archaeon]|nr:hypothetical protein [Candidatus Micrarchaeota archaeon]MDE1834515.1 hypothetical protein [Candidatus Micrarchaeota archaeon]MDE1858925.1 hypothetical protein [Candidatus Micrarchaeota archaeon]
MADKEKQKEKDGKKAKGSPSKSEKSGSSKAQGKNQGHRLILAAIILMVIIAVLVVVLSPSSGFAPTVPFSTFRSSLQTANRISVTVTYSNQSQYANESLCFTSMLEVISHNRKPSTIDFYIIDNKTATCTYSTTGFGGSVNPVTTNSTYCLGKAYAEDGLFLNYSNFNSTRIYSNRMYVYGNNAYMAQCPIAVELS